MTRVHHSLVATSSAVVVRAPSCEEAARVVELGLVEQRYKAGCEVLDGGAVVDVARRNGAARQTVHDWLRRYASRGLPGLAGRSSKPASCPHQMAPRVEARIV